MSYRLVIHRAAGKVMLRLPKEIALRIHKQIHALPENLYPSSSKRFVNYPKGYRLRVGDYRVIYEVWEKEKMIHILEVDHSKDIYRH